MHRTRSLCADLNPSFMGQETRNQAPKRFARMTCLQFALVDDTSARTIFETGTVIPIRTAQRVLLITEQREPGRYVVTFMPTLS